MIPLLALLIAVQCPDGSPPPCRTAARLSLDSRVWLALPFDNLARAPDLDVVRDASATLLYLELSRWSDVQVVDDARVADLVRTAPPGLRLGQQQGFDFARRVGAGRLVMGQLLRQGSRIELVAAVYDVNSGQRLRSPRASMVGTDSMTAAFSRLAQEILAVPALGPRTPAAGTSSTEALRWYAAGLAAERRQASDTAAMYYERAVRHDSTFAMGHFKLWLNLVNVPGEAARAGRHLQTAGRLTEGLPPRERLYINGQTAITRGDIRGGCALFEQLMALDSLDSWPWWARANCLANLFGRPSVIVENGQPRFTIDENARLRAWLRAMALDSTSYGPFAAVMTQLTSSGRLGCSATGGGCADSTYFVAARGFSGDTFWFAPRPWAQAQGSWYADSEDYESRRARFTFARDLARRFTLANPSAWGGHYWLAYTSMALGDLPAAERALETTSAAGRFAGVRRLYQMRRLELELLLERVDAAAALVDSVFLDNTAAEQPVIGTIFGRFSLDLDAQARRVDSMAQMRRSLLPVFAGILPQDYDRLRARYVEAVAAASPPASRGSAERALNEILTMSSFAMHPRRPASDTAALHPVTRLQAYLALRDTARARVILATFDERLNRRPAMALNDGAWLFAAEAYLMLGDSAAALTRLRDFAARWRSFFPNHGLMLGVRPDVTMNGSGRLHGRTWLLTGDLALAAGDRDLARRAYRMVVGLWQGGEPPVQPMVARARAALEVLR